MSSNRIYNSRNKNGVYGSGRGMRSPTGQQTTEQAVQSINVRVDTTRLKQWENNPDPCYPHIEKNPNATTDSYLDEGVLAFTVVGNRPAAVSSRAGSSSDDLLPVLTRLNGAFSRADRDRLFGIRHRIRVVGKLRMKSGKNPRNPNGDQLLSTAVPSGHVSLINTGYMALTPGQKVIAIMPHFEDDILRNGGIGTLASKPPNVAVLLTMPLNNDVMQFEAIRHLTEMYDMREARGRKATEVQQELSHHASVLGHALALAYSLGRIDENAGPAGRAELPQPDVKRILQESLASSNVRSMLSYFSATEADGDKAYPFRDQKPTPYDYMKEMPNQHLLESMKTGRTAVLETKKNFNLLFARLMPEMVESAARIHSGVQSKVIGTVTKGAQPGAYFDISLKLPGNSDVF